MKQGTSTLQKVNRILLLIEGGLLLLILALLMLQNSVMAENSEQDTIWAPEATKQTVKHPDESLTAVQDAACMVSVNPAMVLEDGRLNVKIINDAANLCYAQVRIELVERPYDGQMIYSSGILRPSYCIQSGAALECLPAGQYLAVATVSSIDPETEEVTETVRENIVIEAISAAGEGEPAGATAPLEA